MRKIALIMLALLTLTPAAAQTLDFEVGYRVSWESPTLQGQAPFQLSGDARGAYLLARANLPLGSPLFGLRAWVLPEVGLELGEGADPKSPSSSYARVQLVFDGEHATFFADLRSPWSTGGFSSLELRVGARFGVSL